MIEQNGFQIWNQRPKVIPKSSSKLKQQKSCPPVLSVFLVAVYIGNTGRTYCFLQLEETAMNELKLYYESSNRSKATFFTVSRVDHVTSKEIEDFRKSANQK